MSSFNTILRPTPFGFYDADPVFQKDADSMVTFVLRRLGEDVLGVELTKKMIWACFEEATKEFNGIMVEYQTKSNLSSLLGVPTGSIDSQTNFSNINLSNTYIQQNLSFLNDLAAPYAAAIGYGQNQESYSGSIALTNGRQDYDLYSELLDSSGIPLYDLQPSGSVTRLQVYEVYHFAPVQYVFNSNLASNFVANGLPVESYIPDTRFYVLPLFEDVLRAGMLKEAQKIRRSHFSYRMTGRNIRIYPIPTNIIEGMNNKLFIRVGYRQSPVGSLASTLLASGTMGGSTNSGHGSNFMDQTLFGANSPFNVPYGPVAYKSLNIWARNWIGQYTLALATELLGRIRGKFKNFPIPGSELILNGDDLVGQGREDKEKLMASMKESLENLTYDKIAERDANKAEMMVKQLSFVPIPPSWVMKLG